MPIPHLKRRRYGYLEKATLRSSPGSKQRPKRNPKVIQYLSRFLRFALLLPFKTVWWFLALLGRILKRQKAHTGAILRMMGIIAVIGLVGATAYGLWISRNLPDPDRLTDRHIAQSTKIYDRTGEHLLYEIFADQKRTLVTMEQIPQTLIDAVLATEDTEFYQHIGIRPLSIARSFVYGLLGKGRIGGGASTLTQQLVKNAILTNERTLDRKIKEIILSLRLEQKYSKDQILQIYFNEIPYGSTNYGVQAASHSYFGKDVSDLNLEQIATLAGLPKAPSRYLTNSVALKNRRDFVLERMVAEGHITREAADQAEQETPSLKLQVTNIGAPHFVFYVREQLNRLFGEQVVDTGGLKVITSLDWDKQQFAEQAIKQSEDKAKESQANNAAMVAIDPKTGHVLALVGSRDFFNNDIDGQFDVATQGLRQPGSSFKPIIYAAAFEKGYTPETVLFDVSTNFAASGDEYTPQNYDGKDHGLVTMRQALQQSLNIPAVKSLYLVGQEQGVSFAERLGYSTLSTGNFGLSLVLGGGEVKLIEHVSAYGVFANKGIRQPATSILKVEDANGNILHEWKPRRGEQILDEKVAATISNVLSDDAARAAVFGAGGVLTLSDRPVAAKTGTTNKYVDAWTVGYTPSLVAGVWAGNTDNTPMKKGDGGSRVAAPIWNAFMQQALKGTVAEEFPPAPPNDATKPVLRGSGSGITLLIDKVTGKIATSSTPPAYIVERTYVPAHSILHYVQKDDPRGPAPENPASDPQYAIWETAIQNWVNRQREENPNWNVAFGDPPTEFDDAHSLELIPTISILSPAPNTILFSRQINTNIEVSAPRGVSRVTYKIDDKFVGSLREPPFNLNYYAAQVEDGEHVLGIIVEDDIGNRREESIPFTMSAGIEPPRVSWAENNLTLPQNQFPRVFFLNPFKPAMVDEVRIYKQKEGSRTLLTSLTNLTDLFNNQIQFKWNEVPEKGEYMLIAETVVDGRSGNSESLRVTVD